MSRQSHAFREAGRVPVGPLLTMWVLGCVDYNPASTTSAPPTPPVGIPPAGGSGTATAELPDQTPVDPIEICNGTDDDADGVVDEDFPDTDRDGRADCVDDDCEVDNYEARPLDDDRACDEAGGSVSGTIEMELLWSVSNEGYTEGCHVVVAADLDLDGNTELFCSNRTIMVFDGLTGSLVREWEGAQVRSPLAVVDSDADGVPEVWAIDEEGHAIKYDAAGNIALRSVEPLSEASITSSALEGFSWAVAPWPPNAEPAIVGIDVVVSMVDGRTLARFDDEVDRNSYFNVAVLDADLDGEVEIYRSGLRFDPTGRTVARIFDAVDFQTVWVRPMQADADQEAELLWAVNDYWVITDPDGAVLNGADVHVTNGSAVGMPCVVLDRAIGEQFFGLEEAPWFHAMDRRGNQLWERQLVDQSAAVTCSGFDLTLDGLDDIIVSDDRALQLLDGADGTTLDEGDQCTETMLEMPIVVDLDGDGTIEVISYSGLSTCHEPTGQRPLADPEILTAFRIHGRTADIPNHWPINDWSGTELNADLTVPHTQRPVWLTTCAIPAQAPVWQHGTDLAPYVMDSCTPNCEGETVSVSVAIENRGPDESTAAVPVAVYSLSGALLGVASVTDWVDDWSRSAGVEISVSRVEAEAGLVLVAGDDGSGTVRVEDPDEADNRLEWRFNRCD